MQREHQLEDIKRARNERALQLHPDKDLKDEAVRNKAMQAVNKAYEVLRNPTERRKYNERQEMRPLWQLSVFSRYSSQNTRAAPISAEVVLSTCPRPRPSLSRRRQSVLYHILRLRL